MVGRVKWREGLGMLDDRLWARGYKYVVRAELSTPISVTGRGSERAQVTPGPVLLSTWALDTRR